MEMFQLNRSVGESGTIALAGGQGHLAKGLIDGQQRLGLVTVEIGRRA